MNYVHDGKQAFVKWHVCTCFLFVPVLASSDVHIKSQSSSFTLEIAWYVFTNISKPPNGLDDGHITNANVQMTCTKINMSAFTLFFPARFQRPCAVPHSKCYVICHGFHAFSSSWAIAGRAVPGRFSGGRILRPGRWGGARARARPVR